MNDTLIREVKVRLKRRAPAPGGETVCGGKEGGRGDGVEG